MRRNTEFEIGELCYLKTDIDQQERIVTGIMQRPNCILYYLSLGCNETVHYSIEMTKTKDILKSLDINNSSYEN
jgi:hypothetical protein